jgi:uncharacterized membrane protein
VQRAFDEKIGEPDTTFEEADPAQARATVTEAIDHGAMMFPPLETDTWPGCRPLVEWLLSRLPAGGSVRPRQVWSDDDIAALHDDFFASPFGRDLDDRDHRDLLESLTWFGRDYGPGDPLRWSPVNVEMLLVDWIPRKLVAEPEFLAKAPDLLRRFIQYSHGRVGIRRSLTVETLASVDRWAPEYPRLIRSSRPQGPDALIAATMAGDDYLQDEEEGSLAEIMLARFDRAVGGRHVLMNLETDPLPDEPFEWAGIPDDIRERVREVLERCDGCADELFDVEHRTAFRRFLSRAAVGDPAIFRRKGSADRAAAAVCWTVAKANHTVGSNMAAALESQRLLGWFGVKGSVSQRAEAFLKAIGVNARDQYVDMLLGSPDFLVSQRRATIIDLRDGSLAMDE